MSEKITVDGVEYDSIAAAARAHGISRQAVWFRLKSGWALEDALKRPVNNGPAPLAGKTSWVVQGVEYDSFVDALRSVGVVNYTVAYSRLRLGWTLEDALMTPVRGASSK